MSGGPICDPICDLSCILIIIGQDNHLDGRNSREKVLQIFNT